MNNTNFQTIHQMGQAINEVVRQATGRDAVQNIDMDYITVAQNKHYEETSVSGRMVSFNTKTGGLPLAECIVQIEPVQEGSGDPSPDNIRPITGWPGVRIVVSPTTDAEDGETYSIIFPGEVGMVYSGKLNVITGELTVDKAEVKFSAFNFILTSSPERHIFRAPYRDIIDVKLPISATLPANVISDRYLVMDYSAISQNDNGRFAFSPSDRNAFVVIDHRYTAVNDFVAGNSDAVLVYELKTPLTYQLTQREIRTLTGMNNIWADTGDIEVTYKELKELY